MSMSRFEDWLQWKRLRFWQRFGWALRHLLRPRCVRCGGDPAYSWKGDYWPQEWLCKPCTLDPDLEEGKW